MGHYAYFRSVYNFLSRVNFSVIPLTGFDFLFIRLKKKEGVRDMDLFIHKSII